MGGGGNKGLGFLAGGPAGMLIADQLDITGENAAEEALDYQNKATNRANDSLEAMYNTQIGQAKPFYSAGVDATKSLADNKFMDNWQQDPGYMFRMKEGQKAIDNAASARGMGNSGATLKALTQYGQNFGANEYQNVYNRNYQRLSGLAGNGMQALGGMQSAAQNYGNARSGNLIGMGNAQANATMGVHNNKMGLIKDGLSMGSMMMGMPPMGGGPAATTMQGGTRMGSTMVPFR